VTIFNHSLSPFFSNRFVAAFFAASILQVATGNAAHGDKASNSMSPEQASVPRPPGAGCKPAWTNAGLDATRVLLAIRLKRDEA
jgi:hypothetical protein